MATRTSSPPGSRSKSTPKAGPARGSSGSSSGTRSRRTPSGSTAIRKPGRGTARSGRPAPRAVRSGAGPVLRFFSMVGRGLAAVWLGVAHAVGALARRVGRTARDLDPAHRRDGVGLLLIGLAVVAAAAVWWQLPGAVMETARTVVSGSVGKVGWLVPLLLVFIGWRNMRDPERNGPAGRQIIGWTAVAFGVLGIVHIA
ncbi:MAG: DNA translocase FtsK, partial [Sporichthyaceae bacterium]|nr:DNA translocase FtsK [Sporichthyaceae bacterium]